jgi:hypothetical protein
MQELLCAPSTVSSKPLRWPCYLADALFLPSLAPQPSLGLGFLHKTQLNFLEASQQFSFLQGRVVSPTSNTHLGGPGLCIYIPQRQGATHFGRLLRHSWGCLLGLNGLNELPPTSLYTWINVTHKSNDITRRVSCLLLAFFKLN